MCSVSAISYHVVQCFMPHFWKLSIVVDLKLVVVTVVVVIVVVVVVIL